MKKYCGPGRGTAALNMPEWVHGQRILSVRELTEKLRCKLEQGFPFVWVCGEVGNVSKPSSGHIYFNLNDGDSQLQCVWFKNRRISAGSNFDPLTGEITVSVASDIEHGQRLICGGHIGVYAPRGQYQLVVELLQNAGQGMLAQTYQELKQKLFHAGYFAIDRKRPLPANPARVALITSPAGAAVHDFMRVGAARGCSAVIRLFPVLVQGEKAAAQIIEAIKTINEQGWAQAIVIIRGGGSLEDLWAFNDEKLVHAIYASAIPVMTGIGHEIDESLSDLAADVRAATPSHAAQMLWPGRDELRQMLDNSCAALETAVADWLISMQNDFSDLWKTLLFLSPAKKHEALKENYRMQVRALMVGAEHFLERKHACWSMLDKTFAQMLPRERVELMAERHDALNRKMHLCCDRLLLEKQQTVRDGERRLNELGSRMLAEKQVKFERLESDLTHVNPAAPLKKGYAILFAKGRILRSVTSMESDEIISGRLADGTFTARVQSVKTE